MFEVRTLFKRVKIGGIPIAVLSNEQTVDVFETWIKDYQTGDAPKISNSANGEVIARFHQNSAFKADLLASDMINADGMPLVYASKLFTSNPIPERVVTTDLLHFAIRRAIKNNQSFYFLGASDDEISKAVSALKVMYPPLKIVGYHHGYLNDVTLKQRVIEDINAKAPDILWVGMGVPYEQKFALELKALLTNVAIIKTCGGLFNYLSGTRSRAPEWMRNNSLEWLYRAFLEPKRLGWRYLTTNPVAFWHLVTKSTNYN